VVLERRFWSSASAELAIAKDGLNRAKCVVEVIGQVENQICVLIDGLIDSRHRRGGNTELAA